MLAPAQVDVSGVDGRYTDPEALRESAATLLRLAQRLQDATSARGRVMALGAELGHVARVDDLAGQRGDALGRVQVACTLLHLGGPVIGAWGLVASVLVQAVSMVLLMVAVLVIAFLVMHDDMVTGRRRK